MKTFYKSILIIFVLGSYYSGSFAQAPPWGWAHDAGGPGNDLSNSVSANNLGSVFITGRFNDVCHFGNDSVTSFGGSDIFVARYDTYGNLIWVRHGGSTDMFNDNGDVGFGIGTDAFGNCYVTGTFKTQATFGSFTLSSSVAKKEIFVVKYDQNGNVIWAKQAMGNTSNNYSRGIAVDSIGNSYITGYLGGGNNTFGAYTLSGGGAYVVKYDSSGAVMYATKLSTQDNIDAYGISVDHGGNAYISGYLQGTDSISGQVFTSTGDRDAYIIKVDASGHFAWLIKSTSVIASNAYGQSVAVDAQGNVLFTGGFDTFITFGTTTLTGDGSQTGTPTFFVAKFDPNGNLIWAKQSTATSISIPNTFGYSIVTDNLSNAYISGVYRDSVFFDNFELFFYGTAVFVVKYNSSGNCQWATNSAGQAGAFGYGISHNDAGECYVTGFYQNPPVFGSVTLPSHGGQDIFLAKLDETTGVEEFNTRTVSFTISPNPTTGSIQLTIHTKQNTALRCEIINVMGERVWTSPLAPLQRRGESVSADLNLSFLAKGLYLVRVWDGLTFVNKKLIIEK